MNNEFSGGTINRECPDCGQYCKVPGYYHPEFETYQYGDKEAGHRFVGCFANSYCKRCKKKVKLSVEFI